MRAARDRDLQTLRRGFVQMITGGQLDIDREHAARRRETLRGDDDLCRARCIGNYRISRCRALRLLLRRRL